MTKKKPAAKSAKSSKSKAKAAPRTSAKAAAKPTVGAKSARPGAKGKAAVAAKGAAAKANGKAAAGAKGGAKEAAPKKPSRQRVRICKQEGCSNPQTTQGFCRLHYLANWKALREEKAKRAQKNLDRYVERMAGTKKPASQEEGEEGEGGAKEEAVFEEDFGEFVDVLSREENLDKILNGIKVEEY